MPRGLQPKGGACCICIPSLFSCVSKTDNLRTIEKGIHLKTKNEFLQALYKIQKHLRFETTI